MQTQPRTETAKEAVRRIMDERGITEHRDTPDDFNERFARYERALGAVYGKQINTDEAHGELRAARQSLMDISRRARVAFDAKFVPPPGDRLFGKVLKDWATALMKSGGVTRAKAREIILTYLETEVANAQRYKCAPATCTPGCTVMPLDHLPEGSH